MLYTCCPNVCWCLWAHERECWSVYSCAKFRRRVEARHASKRAYMFTRYERLHSVSHFVLFGVGKMRVFMYMYVMDKYPNLFPSTLRKWFEIFLCGSSSIQVVMSSSRYANSKSTDIGSCIGIDNNAKSIPGFYSYTINTFLRHCFRLVAFTYSPHRYLRNTLSNPSHVSNISFNMSTNKQPSILKYIHSQQFHTKAIFFRKEWTISHKKKRDVLPARAGWSGVIVGAAVGVMTYENMCESSP